MKSAIKAEWTKLFTVRSTYALLIISFLVTLLVAFYVLGYRSNVAVVQSDFLAQAASTVTGLVSLFIVLAGALLVTHEYRYNTALYSVTATNNRLKLLAAKTIVITIFSILATALFAVLAVLLALAGAALQGADLPSQSIPYADLLWRILFFGWGYAMLGLILAFIIRNQVGVIITLLLLANTIEALLSLLLRDNATYLPFTALTSVLSNQSGISGTVLSPGDAAIVTLIYLVAGWALAAFLLKKRDVL